MDVALWVKAAVMGVVEGLTEFLPISSTGHLILAGSLLGLVGEKAQVFEIAIQSGAMLAVILVYWQRLCETVAGIASSERAQRFALNVAIAFAPAVALGLLAGDLIKTYLFNAPVVAASFIVGGLIILWAERRPASAIRVSAVDDMSPIDALKVGLAQCVAMIPGVSRSGATIIGGMLLGLSRGAATEFSFYLAVPTLMGAGVYSLYKDWALLDAGDWPMFAIGGLVAFASAYACVRWLLRYIASHTFAPFAWYRIAFGALVLITAWLGWVDWVD